MTLRVQLWCILMILAAAAATAYYYPALPAIIPVHWNVAGQVDGYGPRWQLWLMGPGMMAAMLLMGRMLPWLSPKRFEIQGYAATYGYMMAVLVALFGVIEGIMLAVALGSPLHMMRVLPVVLFGSLILLGNPMGKVKRNFFIGIRTPWTLASERVWHATHRLAGELMVASGALGLLAVWMAAPGWLQLLLGLAWAPVAVVYSLVLYKRTEAT